ncbi:helix-turn-helix domain-containing protein [Gemmatimonas sp.]|uniref:helix-turn-helix domain-containing protein n=1 Tax=Gemmatimonas sp. TaxID=1962908 RepID=UPI0031F31646
MSRPLTRPDALATELRNARRPRGLSIATLAVEAGVSPRLISEFEQGKRSNVSLETALRLLSLVGVSLRLSDAAGRAADPHRPALRTFGRHLRRGARGGTAGATR